MDIFEDSNMVECFECVTPSAIKRPTCSGCMRPKTVCWCPFLPEEPVKTTTHVIILQHGYEEKRRLKTAPMLERSLLPEKCTILKGSRFSLERYALLKAVSEKPNTVLLYPSPDAVELSECAPMLTQSPCTLILLDGTWTQAQGIYLKNKWLNTIKQVKLTHKETSEYVIRTQPTEHALSTLESTALALSILEGRPDMMQTLIQPLRGMCDFQLEHGAVKHQSKQYLVENGLYKKQPVKPWDKVGRSRPRRRAKKTKKEAQEISEVSVNSTDSDAINCDKSELCAQVSEGATNCCHNCCKSACSLDICNDKSCTSKDENHEFEYQSCDSKDQSAVSKDQSALSKDQSDVSKDQSAVSKDQSDVSKDQSDKSIDQSSESKGEQCDSKLHLMPHTNETP